MKNLSKSLILFNYIAIAGILGFFLSIACTVWATIIDSATNSQTTTSFIISVAAFCSFAVFGVSGFILWTKAWFYIFARWKQRTLGTNFLMFLLCLVLSLFAGYILYFIHRSEVKYGDQ